MQKLDLYISSEAPHVRNAAWLKPVGTGFVLNVLFNGEWRTLIPSNGEGTKVNLEEISTQLIGSVQDGKNANTINGAKAFAKAVEKSVKGYVDEKIAGLEEKQ